MATGVRSKMLRGTGRSSAVWVCLVVTLLAGAVGAAPEPTDQVEWTYWSRPGPVTSMTTTNGAVWCGTHTGLYRWDTASMTCQAYRVAEGLPHPDIVSVGAAPDGKLWALTTAGGSVRFDGSSWESHIDKSYPYGLALTIDPWGRPWVAAYRPAEYNQFGGVAWFDGNWTRELVVRDPENPANRILDLAVLRNHVVWALTAAGLAAGVDRTWTFEALASREPPRHVAGDLGDAVWVSTDDSLYHRDLNQFVSHAVRDWLPAGDLLDPVPHPQGGIVLVTANGGATRYTVDGRTLLSAGGQGIRLSACAVAADGTVWGGTVDGDLADLTATGWRVWPMLHTGLPDTVSDLAADIQGVLWATASDGIWRFVDPEWERVYSADALPLPAANGLTLLFDGRDRPWIAAVGQAWMHDGTGWRRPTGLESTPLFDLVGDRDGGVWFKGLTHWRPDGTVERLDGPHPDDTAVQPLGVTSNGTVFARDHWDFNETVYWPGASGWQAQVVQGYDQSEVTGLGFDAQGVAWLTVTDSYSGHGKGYSCRILRKAPRDTSFSLAYRSSGAHMALRAVDRAGRLWYARRREIAQDGVVAAGAGYYLAGTEGTVDLLNGLLGDTVNEIHADSAGGLWFATDRGIARRTDNWPPLAPGDTSGTTPGAGDSTSLSGLALKARPNPTTATLVVSLALPTAAHVRIAVHAVTGQKVKILLDADLPAGPQAVEWDSHDAAGMPVASGVYLVRLQSGQASRTTKVTVMR